MQDLPVIRIHLERFQYSLLAMISEQEAQMDEHIRVAVERFCEPDRLQAEINDLVEREISSALEAEVKAYYSFGGPGRKVIREALRARLAAMEVDGA